MPGESLLCWLVLYPESQGDVADYSAGSSGAVGLCLEGLRRGAVPREGLQTEERKGNSPARLPFLTHFLPLTVYPQRANGFPALPGCIVGPLGAQGTPSSTPAGWHSTQVWKWRVTGRRWVLCVCVREAGEGHKTLRLYLGEPHNNPHYFPLRCGPDQSCTRGSPSRQAR